MTNAKQEREIRELQSRPVHWTCPECKTDVFEPHVGAFCKVCGMIAYLNFRHVMNWPLDAEEKKRLGLI